MRAVAFTTLLLLGSCAAPPPGPPPPRQPPMELAGRAAGPPQHCAPIQQSSSLRVSSNDRHTLLAGDGRTIWANPLGPACEFPLGYVLITEPMGAYYCRGDIVRSIDEASRFPGPTCILGDFIPYTRP